tara:strand:- start:220475 stop:220888 length:414 start_codon:yes stop_codon:yes gene_type:complete
MPNTKKHFTPQAEKMIVEQVVLLYETKLKNLNIQQQSLSNSFMQRNNETLVAELTAQINELGIKVEAFKRLFSLAKDDQTLNQIARSMVALVQHETEKEIPNLSQDLDQYLLDATFIICTYMQVLDIYCTEIMPSNI